MSTRYGWKFGVGHDIPGELTAQRIRGIMPTLRNKQKQKADRDDHRQRAENRSDSHAPTKVGNGNWNFLVYLYPKQTKQIRYVCFMVNKRFS